MPTVPRYGQQQVSTEPLRGGRISPEAPAGAFQPPAPIEVGPLKSVVQEAVQKERERADQIAVTSAIRQLSDYETELLYNPQTGVLNREGKESFSAPEEVRGEWEKRVSDISSTLTTDRQRDLFTRFASNSGVQVNRTVQRHVSEQIKKYDDAEVEGLVTSQQNKALANYTDPEVVQSSIDVMNAVIRDHAARNGLPSTFVNAKVAEATSKVYSGIITRYLADGQDLTAQKFYDAHKEEITGGDQAQLDKALEEGSLRGESQRRSDAIVAKAADRTEALALVAEIKDPRLRDATRDRVTQAYEDRKRAEDDRLDNLYKAASAKIAENPGVPASITVDPTTWQALTPAMQNALESRSRSVVNNDKKWLEFLYLDENKVAQMNQSQFESKYWSHFDQEKKDRAAAIWHEARERFLHPPKSSTEAAAIPEATTLNFKDRTLNAARRFGIVPAQQSLSQLSTSNAKRYAAFEQEADRRVKEFEQTKLKGERRATQAEMQEVIDGLVIESIQEGKVRIDEPHSRDPQVYPFEVTEDEKGRVYVPIDDISQVEREKIRNYIQSSGYKITTKKIERAYAASILNDIQLFNEVIKD